MNYKNEKRVIIFNADDFGRSKGINYGIMESCINGVVKSTTAMVNMPDIFHAANLVNKFGLKELGIGLHFTLTAGKPLTNLISLVEENGEFGRKVFQQGENKTLNLVEIKKELEAQYEMFKKIFSFEPTHIDSHHHVHFIPGVYEMVKEFSLEKNIPIRIRSKMRGGDNFSNSTQCFYEDFYGKELTTESIEKLFNDAEKLDYNSIEIMCHPGFLDGDVLESRYCKERLNEIEILTSERIKKYFEERENIILGNYSIINDRK